MLAIHHYEIGQQVCFSLSRLDMGLLVEQRAYRLYPGHEPEPLPLAYFKNINFEHCRVTQWTSAEAR